MKIYLLTNKVTGKYYVGKTVARSLNGYLSVKRWAARHGKHQNMPVVRSIAKHGWESFSVDVLAVAATKGQLNNLERLWIITLNARDPQVGYNLSAGGAGNGGGPMSAETKAKIGAANKGRKPKGYVRTEQHIQQLRDRMQGNALGEKFTAGNAATYILNETPEQKAYRGSKIKESWARRKSLKGNDFAASG
jgi:group I intron endonuclease